MDCAPVPMLLAATRLDVESPLGPKVNRDALGVCRAVSAQEVRAADPLALLKVVEDAVSGGHRNIQIMKTTTMNVSRIS